MLLTLATVFVMLFYWQRSRSTFLQIEQERAAADALADREGVSVAAVLALRDMIGVAAATDEWQRVVGEFAVRFRGVLRASITATMPEASAVAEAELAAARGMAPNPLAARRFQLLRGRFAARH